MHPVLSGMTSPPAEWNGVGGDAGNNGGGGGGGNGADKMTYYGYFSPKTPCIEVM